MDKVRNIINHDNHDERHHGSIPVPVYQTSLFSFGSIEEYLGNDEKSDFTYSRGNNPTVRELEIKLAALEHAEAAKCFAAGMGAMSASIVSVLKAGDHVVCIDQGYGGTQSLFTTILPRYNVETTFVDGSVQSFIDATRPNTRLFYFESPTSLFMTVLDIKGIVAYAKQHNILTMIDNTWATPLYQNPLDLGVDIVVHSVSKYISGHSDNVAGVAMGSKAIIHGMQNEYMNFGAQMSPQSAALALRGLRTLPIRLPAHAASAYKVADYLHNSPYVSRVNYPGHPKSEDYELAKETMTGYTGLLSYEIKGLTFEQIKKFVNALNYFRIGCSWGGYDSLVLAFEMNKHKNDTEKTILVRMSIGLEDVDTLIEDIDQAFKKAAE